MNETEIESENEFIDAVDERDSSDDCVNDNYPLVEVVC